MSSNTRNYKDLIMVRGRYLYNLVPRTYDRRIQSKVDMDYVQSLRSQLSHPDEAKRREAEDALIFLNDFCAAAYNAHFTNIESFELSADQRSEFASERNAALRDMYDSAKHTKTDLEAADKGTALSLADALDSAREAKRRSLSAQRKSKKGKKNEKRN